MVIAIFCGHGKPSPLSIYLEKFIEEYLALSQTGIKIFDATYKINIDAFLCDAPARAYLKQIKGHTSKFGCEKCCIESQYSKIERKRYYPVNTVNNLRRNEEFLNATEDNVHIKNRSPLLKLGI